MLKRDSAKYVRDLAKSAYKKDTHCAICNCTDKLEFHHYHTVVHLVNKWMLTHPDILETRAEFIAAHQDELYIQTVTLCKPHHQLLHSIYGKDPALGTAEKQKNWVRIQHDKFS